MVAAVYCPEFLRGWMKKVHTFSIVLLEHWHGRFAWVVLNIQY